MQVKLNGIVATEPKVLATYEGGVVLYECYINNTRKSGNVDTIRVTYVNTVLSKGDLVYLEGELRTFRVEGRITLYVHTNNIEVVEDILEVINEVRGSGELCKDVKFRTAINDNTINIADLTLKCSRSSNKYDYIYCSVWNRMTRYCRDYATGDVINILGRLHSHYRGDVLATEVSVYKFRKENAN